MNRVRTFLFGSIPFLTVLALSNAANADWQYQGAVGGYPTWHDTNTGLTWTVTLGRTRSSEWGRGAAAHVAALGFRLPTFWELQTMYNFGGGGGLLGIRNGLFDYYETADPNILGNAFGNGFQTPLQRKGFGYNWYLGVR